MLRVRTLGWLAVLSLAAGAQGHAQWPRFRGPNGDGVARDHPRLPLAWTTTENVKWVVDVPGWGWSSPVVWGDRVFVTTVVSDEPHLTPSKGLYLGQGVRKPAKGVHHWLVFCFDLNTGRLLWRDEAHAGRPAVPRHPKNTYASETPATDGKRLYVLFGDLGLWCYDLQGRRLWSRRIEPKKTFFDYGAASSPVVHQGQVIVVYDNLEGSWIAAFDAETGRQRWRTPRDEQRSWATPLIWANELRTEIVAPGRNRNRGYSLDGRLLWEFDGRMSNLVIPSPFAAHGLCYIASGYVGDPHRPTFAIRPGGRGDLAPDGDFAASRFIAWYQPKLGPYVTSQIVYGDYLYTLYDRGFFACNDARTGEEIYARRRFSPSGSFTSAPFAYNGHIFCLSEDGLTYVVRAGPEFEVVGRNPLDELCLASPAVAGDKLLIRTASKLYCLTEGAKLDADAAARLEPRRRAEPPPDVWSAAAEGRRAVLAMLLEQGVDPNARRRGRGTTPLHIAAAFGRPEIASLLLDRGADASPADRDGDTPLHVAALLGRIDLVKLLLARGADADAKNGRGETPRDLVGSPWNPQLEARCRSLGERLGVPLDLARIQAARPAVAELVGRASAPRSDKD